MDYDFFIIRNDYFKDYFFDESKVNNQYQQINDLVFREFIINLCDKENKNKIYKYGANNLTEKDIEGFLKENNNKIYKYGANGLTKENIQKILKENIQKENIQKIKKYKFYLKENSKADFNDNEYKPKELYEFIIQEDDNKKISIDVINVLNLSEYLDSYSSRTYLQYVDKLMKEQKETLIDKEVQQKLFEKKIIKQISNEEAKELYEKDIKTNFTNTFYEEYFHKLNLMIERIEKIYFDNDKNKIFRITNILDELFFGDYHFLKEIVGPNKQSYENFYINKLHSFPEKDSVKDLIANHYDKILITKMRNFNEYQTMLPYIINKILFVKPDNIKHIEIIGVEFDENVSFDGLVIDTLILDNIVVKNGIRIKRVKINRLELDIKSLDGLAIIYTGNYDDYLIKEDKRYFIKKLYYGHTTTNGSTIIAECDGEGNFKHKILDDVMFENCDLENSFFLNSKILNTRFNNCKFPQQKDYVTIKPSEEKPKDKKEQKQNIQKYSFSLSNLFIDRFLIFLIFIGSIFFIFNFFDNIYISNYNDVNNKDNFKIFDYFDLMSHIEPILKEYKIFLYLFTFWIIFSIFYFILYFCHKLKFFSYCNTIYHKMKYFFISIFIFIFISILVLVFFNMPLPLFLSLPLILAPIIMYLSSHYIIKDEKVLFDNIFKKSDEVGDTIKTMSNIAQRYDELKSNYIANGNPQMAGQFHYSEKLLILKQNILELNTYNNFDIKKIFNVYILMWSYTINGFGERFIRGMIFIAMIICFTACFFKPNVDYTSAVNTPFMLFEDANLTLDDNHYAKDDNSNNTLVTIKRENFMVLVRQEENNTFIKDDDDNTSFILDENITNSFMTAKKDKYSDVFIYDNRFDFNYNRQIIPRLDDSISTRLYYATSLIIHPFVPDNKMWFSNFSPKAHYISFLITIILWLAIAGTTSAIYHKIRR